LNTTAPWPTSPRRSSPPAAKPTHPGAPPCHPLCPQRTNRAGINHSNIRILFLLYGHRQNPAASALLRPLQPRARSPCEVLFLSWPFFPFVWHPLVPCDSVPLLTMLAMAPSTSSCCLCSPACSRVLRLRCLLLVPRRASLPDPTPRLGHALRLWPSPDAISVRLSEHLQRAPLALSVSSGKGVRLQL
jgi:hypothetical protein